MADIRNAPFWGLIIVLTIFSPITNQLMKRQLWPFNPPKENQ